MQDKTFLSEGPFTCMYDSTGEALRSSHVSLESILARQDIISLKPETLGLWWLGESQISESD